MTPETGSTPSIPDLLTIDNYSRGFLVDEEWMAGITTAPDSPDQFFAFIVSHLSGEYVAYQPFSSLAAALNALNALPRSWIFEKVGGCGSGNCGAGNCKGGGCKIKTASAEPQVDSGCC